MTYLEILAERLDCLATLSSKLATKYANEKSVFQRGYYDGKVVAFGVAADILRQEALAREGTDKEVKE